MEIAESHGDYHLGVELEQVWIRMELQVEGKVLVVLVPVFQIASEQVVDGKEEAVYSLGVVLAPALGMVPLGLVEHSGNCPLALVVMQMLVVVLELELGLRRWAVSISDALLAKLVSMAEVMLGLGVGPHCASNVLRALDVHYDGDDRDAEHVRRSECLFLAVRDNCIPCVLQTSERHRHLLLPQPPIQSTSISEYSTKFNNY